MGAKAPPSKRPWQYVLANRCMMCNLPKHLHERNGDGDIRLKADAVPVRIDYPDICQPNPFIARKMDMPVQQHKGLFFRRPAPLGLEFRRMP